MSRLDRALVDRGLVNSRSRAAREIAAGRVSINGHTSAKASHDVTDTDELTVTAPDPWVARSAHKLLGALDAFGLTTSGTTADPSPFAGLTALDAGASTGGFTQVLLHHGVSDVWAVDVGHDQLAPVLRDDPRVHVREGLNLRELADSDVPTVDLVVADVSFISLRLLIGPLLAATAAAGDLLLMVKPQFELARASLDKHGVVTSRDGRRRAIDSVLDAVNDHDARVTDIAPSSLPGPSGNREYFLRVRPGRTHDQSDRLDQADIPAHLDEMMRGES
ncbi:MULTISPECIES: TlyA family RNA methyltransferase [unclassified Brevibacterium]|uniref:TlyA family RNA methyltransferase n=1 Tax=unclassified Brevibacterium TaxID=2614124 RepID=UPI0010923BD7|nr:TlyA family RNA methyltransferase [Brevibacterium sp. S22]TGD28213.1 TlyA family RNA methyltransferase [Brevibacterium sp. S22]